MKKYAFLFLLFLIFISCGSDDNGSSIRNYFISFEVDGVSKRYDRSFGESQFGDLAFASIASQYQSTALFAQPSPTYYSNALSENCIILEFNNVTNSNGDFVSVKNIMVDYRESGLQYETTNFTITITNFEDVGGIVQGTFYGTVYRSGDIKVLTNGVIKVKRLPDNTF